MSIEQKLETLTAAVIELTAVMKGGAVPATLESTEREPAAEKPSKTTDDTPDLVWYHKPDTREVWQEPEAGRRKGIVKVDESTAEKLIAKYEAEADESTESGDDNFGDMDLDEEDGGAEFDESEAIDNDTFAKHWREFTKAATTHALEAGAEDDEAAQKEVKKFILPLVKKFGEGDKPKIASIPEGKRAAFLNKAQGFFA